VNDRHVRRRLRVGYVSADFNSHAVRYFLSPLLERHDHGAVEVFAYADVKKPDQATEEYRCWADHWVDAVPLTDEALARRVRDDRIDILVDLSGHTDGNRLRVFARKRAGAGELAWASGLYHRPDGN